MCIKCQKKDKEWLHNCFGAVASISILSYIDCTKFDFRSNNFTTFYFQISFKNQICNKAHSMIRILWIKIRNLSSTNWYSKWCLRTNGCVRMFSSVWFRRSVMSNSFQRHGLQRARLPCPSPTPRAYSNSCPLSRWCFWCRLFLIVCVCELSRVWLFAIPWTVAHQAPLSMEFSQRGYWSGLPFPSPCNSTDISINCMEKSLYLTNFKGLPLNTYFWMAVINH